MVRAVTPHTPRRRRMRDDADAAGRTRVPTEGLGNDLAPPWFGRLFALAVVAHIVGNPPSGWDLRGLFTLALGCTAITLVWRPPGRLAWATAAVLQLWTVWLQAPVLGNHWLLMGFFSLAILLSLPRSDPWRWLAPTLRLLFLGFYAFAAFAKLNTGFLDPQVSCAVFYTNQGLASWGLPTLPAGGALGMASVLATLAVELSVPVLLLVARTRTLGVAVAAVFHLLISADLGQHFYDFTAVVLLGLALFASAGLTGAVDTWIQRRPRLAVAATLIWTACVVAAVLPTSVWTLVLTRYVVFAVWLPTAASLAWLAVRHAGRPGLKQRGGWSRDMPVTLRPPDLAAGLVLLLVVLNGVSPYVGAKTAFGFNMYANLVTADGTSNHVVVSRPATLVDAEYVEVVRTDDEALRAYVGSGWSVPERNLRHHLADHPDARVTFVRGDGTSVTGSGRRLARRMPLAVYKLAPLRSADMSEPARCQAEWLPAL